MDNAINLILSKACSTRMKKGPMKKKPTETKLIKLTFKTIYFNRRNLQLVEERIWKKLKEKTENRNNRNII